MALDKPIYDEESDRTLLDVISEAKVTDPEEMIIKPRRIYRHRIKNIRIIKRFRKKILSLYLDGVLIKRFQNS